MEDPLDHALLQYRSAVATPDAAHLSARRQAAEKRHHAYVAALSLAPLSPPTKCTTQEVENATFFCR